MKIQIPNIQLLRWIDEMHRMNQSPTLLQLLDRNRIAKFFKDNESVFDAVKESHAKLISDHYVLDENGNVKQEDAFEDRPTQKVEKSKLFGGKDKVIESVEKVNIGKQPVLLEGKTKEMYDKAMDEFLNTQVSIDVKPTVINKTPFVLQ